MNPTWLRLFLSVLLDSFVQANSGGTRRWSFPWVAVVSWEGLPEPGQSGRAASGVGGDKLDK